MDLHQDALRSRRAGKACDGLEEGRFLIRQAVDLATRIDVFAGEGLPTVSIKQLPLRSVISAENRMRFWTNRDDNTGIRILANLHYDTTSPITCRISCTDCYLGGWREIRVVLRHMGNLEINSLPWINMECRRHLEHR